uniref:Uncharacterized protein n=1 Tax=viral metagenome TaxID=1070528 RepID=A0A6M3KKG3_9ZZZZ
MTTQIEEIAIRIQKALESEIQAYLKDKPFNYREYLDAKYAVLTYLENHISH